jgi:predicted TPR repeat methyltransferase
VFYDILKCDSPATIREMLGNELGRAGVDPSALRVLDLGAGNGMVGEELIDLGASKLVGVDIIEAARDATCRDRPDVYEDYLVTDMTNPPDEDRECLRRHRLNCLTCVAALGFGDIPTRAFIESFNLIEEGGWVAFNIKDRFLDGNDRSGFSRLVSRITKDGTLEIEARRRYRHRLATNGEMLYYVALVGRKTRDIVRPS